jgi:hypothetical protein
VLLDYPEALFMKYALVIKAGRGKRSGCAV